MKKKSKLALAGAAVVFGFAMSLDAGAANKDLVDEARRWAWAAGGDEGSLLAYLRDYPDGAHAAEARRIMAASDFGPLGRVVDPSPACRDTLDERVEEFLQSARKHHPAASEYEFSAPKGYFLTHASLEFAPRGQPIETSPVEKIQALDLSFGRDGGCTVMDRWSHGSGLGEACRCEPIEAGFSWVARDVLKRVSTFEGANEACVALALGPDHAQAIQAYLSEAIAAYGDHARRLPAGMKQTDAQNALPLLAAGKRDQAENLLANAGVHARNEQHRPAYCSRGLALEIDEARERLTKLDQAR